LARGFESKDVEFQQAEAARSSSPRPALTPIERERHDRRRTIELALARAKADLAVARASAHRQMLTDAIGALEDQLASLQST